MITLLHGKIETIPPCSSDVIAILHPRTDELKKRELPSITFLF